MKWSRNAAIAASLSILAFGLFLALRHQTPLVVGPKDPNQCSSGQCVPNMVGECHQVELTFDQNGRLNYGITPMCNAGIPVREVAMLFEHASCPEREEFIARRDPGFIMYALYEDGRCWPAFVGKKLPDKDR